MEAKTLAELQQVATVTPVTPPLSRRQKLLLWADALDAEYRFSVLLGMWRLERMSEQDVRTYRVGLKTPYWVALKHPALRAAGLKEAVLPTTVGECMDFFELTKADLHRIDCECHGNMRGYAVATRIRKVAGRETGWLAARIVALFRH